MKDFAPLKDAKPVMSILSRVVLLGGLSDAQRDQVIRLLETAEFSKGEYISKAGDEPLHIFIVREGGVGLLIQDADTEIKKRDFSVGECFGEAAFLAAKNKTASFVAQTDCKLIALSWHTLNQLRRKDPDLACALILNLARDLARKLQFTDEILLQEESQQRDRT